MTGVARGLLEHGGVAHVDDPPVTTTARTVTLIGGVLDGKQVQTASSILDVPLFGHGKSIERYRMERMMCRWPVPGWMFQAVRWPPVGSVRKYDQFIPVWITRVFATEERHEAIRRHFDRFDAALRMMELARIWPGDDRAHEACERMVRQEVDELVALTTPGYDTRGKA